jgi:hypothetical protein
LKKVRKIPGIPEIGVKESEELIFDVGFGFSISFYPYSGIF